MSFGFGSTVDLIHHGVQTDTCLMPKGIIERTMQVISRINLIKFVSTEEYKLIVKTLIYVYEVENNESSSYVYT